MSMNDIYAQAHDKRKAGNKKRKAREIISETIRNQEECIRKKSRSELENMETD